MLPGFLTTALEIIIILDICGAIVYFALTGFSRAKKQPEQPETAPLQNASPVLRSFGINSPALAPVAPIPSRQTSNVYAPEPAQSPPEKGRRWTSAFQLGSLKRAFTYRRAANGTPEKTPSQTTEHDRLGRVLDSFKEET